MLTGVISSVAVLMVMNVAPVPKYSADDVPSFVRHVAIESLPPWFTLTPSGEPGRSNLTSDTLGVVFDTEGFHLDS